MNDNVIILLPGGEDLQVVRRQLTLEFIQGFVGGFYEHVQIPLETKNGTSDLMLVNELPHMSAPENRLATGLLYDFDQRVRPIRGPVIIAGAANDNGDYTDVSAVSCIVTIQNLYAGRTK